MPTAGFDVSRGVGIAETTLDGVRQARSTPHRRVGSKLERGVPPSRQRLSFKSALGALQKGHEYGAPVAMSRLTNSGQWRADGKPYSLVSSMPCLLSYLAKIYEDQQMPSRTILAILLLLQCLTTRAGAVALISADASNCREFTAVEKNKLAPYDRTASWIFGFLSGVATASDRDVLRGLDPNATVDWISNYCRQNPNDSLDTATAKLFQALTTRK
jgi:hypothetical protein